MEIFRWCARRRGDLRFGLLEDFRMDQDSRHNRGVLWRGLLLVEDNLSPRVVGMRLAHDDVSVRGCGLLGRGRSAVGRDCGQGERAKDETLICVHDRINGTPEDHTLLDSDFHLSGRQMDRKGMRYPRSQMRDLGHPRVLAVSRSVLFGGAVGVYGADAVSGYGLLGTQVLGFGIVDFGERRCSGL